MRPGVGQLLGWHPAGVDGDGGALLARAVQVERAVEQLQRTAAGLRAGWSGAAADAALAHLDRRSQEVQALAELLHAAGLALIRTGQDLARAQQSLRATVATAGAAGCTVTDGGAVTPPPQPSAPAGLTGEALAAWRQQAEQTARQDAATAARLAGLIDAALTAAAAADSAGQGALARLAVPTLSPPPTLVRLGLLGGDFGPVGIGPLPAAPLPSCPTTPPAPAPEENEHGWLYNSIGAMGNAAYDAGPGTISAALGLIPTDTTQRLGQSIDQEGDDLGAWYGADTDSRAYKFTNAGGQVAGVIGTGGAGGGRLVIRGAKEAAEELAESKADDAAQALARPLPTPQVLSPRLQNVVNDLYKGTAAKKRLGDGTTMAAIRNEIRTNRPTRGRWHDTKGREAVTRLEKWLSDNPEAPAKDRVVAQSLLDDLQRALRGE